MTTEKTSRSMKEILENCDGKGTSLIEKVLFSVINHHKMTENNAEEIAMREFMITHQKERIEELKNSVKKL